MAHRYVHIDKLMLQTTIELLADMFVFFVTLLHKEFATIL